MVATPRRRQARPCALQRAAAVPRGGRPARRQRLGPDSRGVAATRPDGTALELRLSTPMPDGRWLVELRLGPAPFAGGSEGERICAARRGARRAAQPLRHGRRLWVATSTCLSRARPLPRRARPADPLRLRVAAVAARDATRTSTPSSPAASSRRARASVHARTADAPHRKGRAGRADHAPHGRLVARARRDAVSRVVPRARAHRAARERGPRLGRPRRRGRDDRRARARDGCSPDGTVESGEGWTSLVVTPETGLPPSTA